MAKQVTVLEIGIDVSQAELVIARADSDQLTAIANDPQAIKAWLKSLTGPVRIGIEATNTYHLALTEAAHRAGHPVFVVDGYCLNQYRKSLRGRAKTDATDARLILRYLNREWQDLRVWVPPSRGYRTLQGLLHRRAALVKARRSLHQSFKGLKVAGLSAAKRAAFKRLDALEATLNQLIIQTIKTHDWQADFKRLQALEGFGKITPAAMVMAFNRGAFKSADAFIAFLGLDVRVKESGTYKGRCRLTKQGDPELRRLLYLAAMAACRSAAWVDFYQRHLDRGLTRIQALNALARKLARVAFSLLKNQTTYQPRITQET